MLFDYLRRKKRIRRGIRNITKEKLQDIRSYVEERTSETGSLHGFEYGTADFTSPCEEARLREPDESQTASYATMRMADQMPTVKTMAEPMLCPLPAAASVSKFSYIENCKKTKAKSSSINDYVEKFENQEILSFGEYLQQLINRKGMTNKEVYFESNLSKQYFSKLINNKVTSPAKEKLLCIAVAMKLNMDETRDFLLHAGYAISPYSKTDLVFEYFIQSKNYDVYEISYTLEELGIEGGLWPELAV